jgi:hypothetical protein
MNFYPNPDGPERIPPKGTQCRSHIQILLPRVSSEIFLDYPSQDRVKPPYRPTKSTGTLGPELHISIKRLSRLPCSTIIIKLLDMQSGYIDTNKTAYKPNTDELSLIAHYSIKLTEPFIL